MGSLLHLLLMQGTELGVGGAAATYGAHPPETFVVDPYQRKARVNALYNEGWWEGIVERALAGMRYRVYFEGTGDRMEFHHSELCPHWDWVDGKWVMPSPVS